MNRVLALGACNLDFCKIQVPSKVKVEQFRALLAGYSDTQLCDLLTYGFPTNGCLCHRKPKSTHNHAGANNFSTEIDRYLEKECRLGVVMGPYQHNPFDRHPVLSPP